MSIVRKVLSLLFFLMPLMLWAQQFVVSSNGKPLYCRVLDKHSVAVCAPFSTYAAPYTARVVIPSQVRFHRHKYDVVTVAAGAFDGSTQLQSVEIAPSVTTIEYGAFHGCVLLHEVVLPSSVMHVDERAFARCTQLRKITFSNGQCQVHVGAFDGCGDSLVIACPETTRADTTGLLRRQYYAASCFRECQRLAQQMQEQRELRRARLAGDFRNDIRQSMEEQRLKWEEKQGQKPQDRPQVSPAAPRSTPLGNKGD